MSSSLLAATPLLTPDRFHSVRKIFDSALELSVTSRSRHVAEATRHDPSLRDEVESLLAALDRAGSTLPHPFADDLEDALESDAAERDAPESYLGVRVGAYELVRRIGAGGMGVVYEAERADDQFNKRVAIKLLRRGVEGDLAVRRFRYERQILASLNHRNIASLLDGGVTSDGQPYFVMELVPGTPITTWCDQRRASVTERIEIFLQVCAAVQHAHQTLVVHRDLKPGNILVTDDGTVKLLDFGIARLLREQEGLDQLPPTQGGLRALTPEYASPEQIRGLPVGTPGDVYALGVVLYELLAGCRPLELDGMLLAEIEQIVCAQQPLPPSAAIRSTFSQLVRERSVGALRARLEGDLDAIVLTALRKESHRRYGSVQRLADDLRNFLAGRPVTARPEGIGYRAAKVLRRRRVECLATSAVVLALAGALVMSARETALVARERAHAQEVTRRLTDVLARHPEWVAAARRDPRFERVVDEITAPTTSR